jgi:hypothetical protein
LLGIHLTKTLGTRDHLVARRRALRAVGRLDGFWSEARGIVNELWMGRPISEVTEQVIADAAKDKARALRDFDALSAEAKSRLDHRLQAILLEATEGKLAVVERLNHVRTGIATWRREEDEKKLREKDIEIARLQGTIEGLTASRAYGSVERSALISAGTTAAPLIALPPPVPPATAQSPSAPSSPSSHLSGASSQPWPTFKAAFYKFRGVGDSATKSYELAFRRLPKVVGDRPIGDIKAKDIRTFRDNLETETVPRGEREAPSASNIQKMLSNMKTFFAWASSEGEILSENPAANVFVTPAQKNKGETQACGGIHCLRITITASGGTRRYCRLCK